MYSTKYFHYMFKQIIFYQNDFKKKRFFPLLDFFVFLFYFISCVRYRGYSRTIALFS